MKKTDHSIINYFLDLFSPMGVVTARKMFGGYGIYHQGLMFAAVIEDTLYLKVGRLNISDYEKAGVEPFVYQAKTRKIKMSYWQVPADVLEEPEVFIEWAKKSYAVAIQQKKSKH